MGAKFDDKQMKVVTKIWYRKTIIIIIVIDRISTKARGWNRTIVRCRSILCIGNIKNIKSRSDA